MRAPRIRSLLTIAAIAVAFFSSILSVHAQEKRVSTDASTDSILNALQTELARSQAQLKIDNIGAPFYIEYRIFDVDQFEANATYGALVEQNRSRIRLLRVVVRIGDYKVDSYYGPGTGLSDIMPLDGDELALRHQIWLATDQAYKRAGEAYAAKQSLLRQLNVQEPVDDFAKAQPIHMIGPAAKLEVDSSKWTKMLESATSVFKTDPKVEALDASLNFIAMTDYLVNTEGSVTRQGYTHYLMTLSASEQASDGMRLDRSPQFSSSHVEELPTPEQFHDDALKLMANMKALREAPIVEEEYRGPVLFSDEAADDMFFTLFAPNVLGRKPQTGRPARTTGSFASSFKARVLPNFISVVDDPTMDAFGNRSLGGSYKVDDEGVPASAVTVVDKGELVNFLVGRQPIRDFPGSNGHGRAAGNGTTAPSVGNLFFRPNKASTLAELKKQMLDMCRERGLKYGYFVQTISTAGLVPRILYRVWVDDGHEEMVRGAVFNELDTRALRSDLVSAGDDPLISNRSGLPFASIISPSMLFDELEVKRADNTNEKLPDYAAPSLSAQER